MMVKAWTDYPIIQLGDVGGQLAPIRLCDVLSYDGSLYCRIRVGDVYETVKHCYLYKKRGRVGKVPRLSNAQFRKLPRTEY